MTAGVPGLGLSGLFVLLCVFWMPGSGRIRSTRRDAHAVRPGGIFAQAVAIAVAIFGTWVAVSFVVDVISGGTQPSSNRALGSLLGVPVIAISFGMLMIILLAGEIVARVADARPTPAEPPVQTLRDRPDPPGAAPIHSPE